MPPPASGREAVVLSTRGDLAPDDLELGLEVLDLLGDVHVWFIPAATIGGPGLLVLLWLGLQAAGALAWMPAVRRLRGIDEVRNRP